MTRIGLTCSPRPEGSRSARIAAVALQQLGARVDVELYVPEPFRLPAGGWHGCPPRALGELPRRVDELDCVVHVLGDGPATAPLLRLVRECPGVVVLAGASLHAAQAAVTLDAGFLEAYREQLEQDVGGPAAGWSERVAGMQAEHRRRWFGRVPMFGLLQGSDAVVVPAPGVLAALRAALPDTPLLEIPPVPLPRQLSRPQARDALGLETGRTWVGWWSTSRKSPGRAAMESVARRSDVAVLAPVSAPGLEGAHHVPDEVFTGLGWDALDAVVVEPAAHDRFPDLAVLAGAGRGVPVLSLGPHRATGGHADRIDPVDATAIGAWLDDLASRESAPAPAVDLAEPILRHLSPARRVGPVQVRGVPRVEAVILGYRSAPFIERCLRSLQAQDYPNLGITVLDNASGDGTGDAARKVPGVRVIDSSENLGFAGGNNRLFEACEADYYALLNQDAVARPDWVRELVDVAERDESIAMCGSKMLMMRCPSILNSTGIRINRGGFAVDRQIGRKDESDSPTPEHLFGACAGALLLRASAVERLGGFDDRFFMYFEDVDLCWRINVAGMRVYYVPTAVVLHDWHGDLAGDSEATEEGVSERIERRRYLCERNRLQCLVKNYERPNLGPALRDVWAFERRRMRTVRRALREQRNVPYMRMVKRSVRRAWRWNLLHAFDLLRRRRRVQGMRRVPDSSYLDLMDEGCAEASHVGDLNAIRDAYSATGTQHIVMGRREGDSLGAGWHPAEIAADQDGGMRWTMDRAWFYLRCSRPWSTLHVRMAPRPVPTRVTLTLDGVPVGSRAVPTGTPEVLSFAVPGSEHDGLLVEGVLECSTFSPAEVSGSPDHRRLGLHLAEIWVD